MKREELEKLIGIISLIVVGAGIFGHSINLDGKVRILSEKSSSTEKQIIKIKENIDSLEISSGEVNANIKNNKEGLKSLEDAINESRDSIKYLSRQTIEILRESLSGKIE